MEPDTGVQRSHVIALPNKPYLDSSRKLILTFDGSGAGFRLSCSSGLNGWSARLRAMMESRSRTAGS